MNNFTAQVTHLLWFQISTQLQQSLPRDPEVLKLQKQFEQTCKAPGRYGGGAKKEEKAEIIKQWKKSLKDKVGQDKGKRLDRKIKKYKLGLVGKHSE